MGEMEEQRKIKIVENMRRDDDSTGEMERDRRINMIGKQFDDGRAKIRQEGLQRFGHVQQAEEDCIVKIVENLEVAWMRPVGIPKKT